MISHHRRCDTPPRFNVVSENRPSQKEPSLPTIIFEGYVKLRGCTPIKSTPTRNKGLWKGLLATIVLIWDDMGGFKNLPQICSAIVATTLLVKKKCRSKDKISTWLKSPNLPGDRKVEDARHQESIHTMHLTTLDPTVQDEGLLKCGGGGRQTSVFLGKC